MERGTIRGSKLGETNILRLNRERKKLAVTYRARGSRLSSFTNTRFSFLSFCSFLTWEEKDEKIVPMISAHLNSEETKNLKKDTHNHERCDESVLPLGPMGPLGPSPPFCPGIPGSPGGPVRPVLPSLPGGPGGPGRPTVLFTWAGWI